MKFKFFKYLLLLTFGAFLFTSCSDDSEDPIEQTSTNPLPQPGDADGIMAAIKAKSNTPGGTTVPGLGDIYLDVASANFYTSAGGTSLVNVGDVSLNDFDLQTVSNSYINNYTDITLDINSGQANDWVVSGANGFDGFSHSTSKKMPSVVKFATSVTETISISGDVTLAIESIPSNCDNILWLISDGSKVVTKESKTTSVTFTASELSGVKTTSNGIVQAAAYNSESKTFGGKKIYFINETVDSKYVTLN
ncbi:hypothetical protein [Algoriphagus sp. PAP.12]|jgi:hypothetical protein|uniref:hypothetical protein n=1 Tax=Algoriphagus sp. PAP.12 TaxID=2996678 RepID=UPI00227B21C6|nr:hypothetical protein [Algoriphagus sp. PAP.12]